MSICRMQTNSNYSVIYGLYFSNQSTKNFSKKMPFFPGKFFFMSSVYMINHYYEYFLLLTLGMLILKLSSWMMGVLMVRRML